MHHCKSSEAFASNSAVDFEVEDHGPYELAGSASSQHGDYSEVEGTDE